MSRIAVRPDPKDLPRLSLTAAASKRKIGLNGGRTEIKQEGWQSRMWDFYDNLGCVHYGIAFKRNAAAKVAYFAAEKDDNDEDLDPQPTDNQQVIEAVERLRSKYGGLKEIVAELMIHINVPGEGYLVGQGGLESEEWDVWSVEEAQKASLATSSVLDDPDIARAEGEIFAARIWRPHARDRSKADAPLRPVAQQCEQLLLLEDSISAAAKSRLSAGFFYLPSELDIGDLGEFEKDFIAVLTTPIKESDSAARWAPGLIRGPAQYFSSLGPITFSREIDSTFANMREELVRSIAAGLDLPAEIILGKADLNHWTGWEIDESAFRDHVDPDIILIMDSITRGYLHPALEAAGVEDPEKYLIWRDLSDLGARPPSVDEGIRLKEAGVVKDEWLRNLIGAGEEDKPGEAAASDPAIDTALTLLAGAPSLAKDPGLPALVAQLRSVLEGTPLPEVPETPPPPVEGIPDRSDSVLVAAVGSRALTELALLDRILLEKISEASDAAFSRVLERAGAKIRTHAKKDRAIAATIERTPNEEVTRLLGETLTAQLQITPTELVPDGSFDNLGRRIRSLFKAVSVEVADRLESLTGARPKFDDARREAAIVTFLTALSALALRLLFRPSEPSPGEVGDSVVPAGLIVDMMTEAGGAIPASGPSTTRGFATGADSTEWITRHGIRVASHRWEYGDASSRAQPFPPHRNLDQVEFDSWEDERLSTPASASWLSVSHMFPGDHRGCRCMTVPVIVTTRRAA